MKESGWSKEEQMFHMMRNAQKFYRNAPPPTHSVYDNPPTHWFHLVLYVAHSPLEHEAIRRLPLLTVLAYADDKARREKAERELIEASFKMGVPMAGLFGRSR